jgi:hypothetical protein
MTEGRAADHLFIRTVVVGVTLTKRKLSSNYSVDSRDLVNYCNVLSLSNSVITESHSTVNMREDMLDVVRFLYTILPRIYKYIKRRHMYAMFVSERRRKRRSSVEESTP